MEIVPIALFALVCLTALLGICALAGLLISTWFILLPIVLAVSVLICFSSGLSAVGPQAMLLNSVGTLSALLLAGVVWAEYRIWRG